MKIVLTGGGSGGHFFPIIAVVEAINDLAAEKRLLEPDLYYLAPEPYDEKVLFENDIEYRHVSAGKLRRYFSIKNFFDIFGMAWGVLKAIGTVFSIYPDVVFAKGGGASFPVLVAARILRIPVVIHESDSAPGRVNKWAGKFAHRIAVSYPQATQYFRKEDQDKVAYTGNPIRHDILHPALSGAREYLDLDEDIPVILVLGGSQGAAVVNGIILDALPRLIEKYYIIHQTGKDHLKSVQKTTELMIQELPVHKRNLAARYKPFAFLDTLALRMAAGAADLVISRAGSTIFEIANWQVPAILIPITDSNADHQRKNAYAYARSGAGIVMEEENLSDDIMMSQITTILEDEERYKKMVEGAGSFAKKGAARTIAQELLYVARLHK